ncbi:MAG: hypothetical protein AAGK22_02765 [Acidobacteriota bacterium]
MGQVRLWTAQGALNGCRRSAEQARELLTDVANPPEVHLFPRSDGPGSSQDLPQFAAMGTRLPGAFDFSDPSWAWSRECLRTPGACIDGEPIVYRILPAENPDAFEYYSPDFHDEPLVVTGEVPGEVRFFVHNVLAQFGLRGLRIEADPMPSVYRGTGLGGSNLAHGGAMILASALTGADLSLGQIYIAATQNENYFGVTERGPDHLEYGVSLTGGQETLTAFQGGFWDNVHVGHLLGPYSVVSRELVAPDGYADVARHMALINVGAKRGQGVTSSGVNHVWMKAWRDPKLVGQHIGKRELAYRASEALRHGDWPTYCSAVRSYREARTELCAAYLNGQDELGQLCERYGVEYFPLGGGSGTCMVCGEDEAAVASVVDAVRETADPSAGRTALEFAVRENGLEMRHFEECGLEEPAGPEEIESAEQNAA